MNGRWQSVLAWVVPTLTVVAGIWYFALFIAGERQQNIEAYSQLSNRVTSIEQQVAAMKELATSHYAEEGAFRTEMRNGLARSADLLTELRLELGKTKK